MSKKMFINVENPPVYNPDKHFYEQDESVISFYEEEFRRIKEGVTIGGYFFHPWLYFHINFFKAYIPQPDKNGRKQPDKLMVPPLDDNVLYVIESYKKAEEQEKGLCLFGCRGATKSTYLASLTHWKVLTNQGGVADVTGGTKKDLDDISGFIECSLENIHPFLYIPKLKGDWETRVSIGIKDKSNKPLVHAYMRVTNADQGKKNKSEKGAGGTPCSYIIDEIGKFSFLGTYESAKPAFESQYGQRFVPVLSGTSGNAKLSIEAKKVLSKPHEYNMLECDWDRLEKNVPKDCITWERSKKSKFTTFIPGQMSYRLPVKKKEIEFIDFLGYKISSKNKDLKGIKIKVTDWEKATAKIKDTLKLKTDEDSKNKYKMYYPLETADCFLTQAINPFPTKVVDRHIRKLEDEGKIGKNIELIRQDSKIKTEFSDKVRSDVSHPGGVSDAPIIAFGHIPETPSPKNMHAAGFDGYKIDLSETDSLGSVYVLKRRYLEPNSPCETIVASYTARPYKMREFNNTAELLIESLNATCLMEGIDLDFQRHLENKNKHYEYLAKSITFSSTGKLTQEFGMYPSKQNNEHRFNLLIDWCKTEHVVGINEKGEQIIKTGVEFIDDIDLLKEMLSYTKGGNFDRITAFSHALVQCREMDKNNLMPDTYKRDSDAMKKKPKKKTGKYGNLRRFKKY